MLRTVIPVRSRQLADRHLAGGSGCCEAGGSLIAPSSPPVSGGAGRSSRRRRRSRGRRSPSAMCSAGVKVGNSLPGLSARIRGVRIASTTTMLAVAPVGGEAVGEGEGPGLGGRLGRGVGGVGVGGRLGLLGGDEDEAAVGGGDELVVEGAGGVLDGADQEVVQEVPVGERRLVQRLSAAPAADQVQRGRRPGRSARPAPRTRPRVASSSSRSTTRPSQRSSGEPSSAPIASRLAWSRSVPATIAPASAKPLGDHGPRPPPTPAMAITRPSRETAWEAEVPRPGGGRIRTCVGRANGFTARLL